MYRIDQQLKPIRPLDPLRLDWEEDLMHFLEVYGEMDRSDAQGFQMCRQDATDSCYEGNMLPSEAAAYLLNEEER